MRSGVIIDDFGVKRWYLNDLLHREDGPAIEYIYSKKWYYKGEKIYVNSQEEFKRYLELMVFK